MDYGPYRTLAGEPNFKAYWKDLDINIYLFYDRTYF